MRAGRHVSALLAMAAAVVALAAEPVAANPLVRDLGEGLLYHRVRQLPADLPTAEASRRQPCVLDLRYVSGDAEAAAALAAWLRFHATARAPVFILANAATGAALVRPLTEPRPGASIVVIGAAAPGFAPDIALKISAETERAAYDALERGASIASLIVENADKPRNDEARLAKAHQGELGADDTLEGAASTEAQGSGKPAKSTAVIDAALQRAVQLHRAMLALKKL